MWLIVGLGNPGPQYEWTRHNCGFMVVDELARRVSCDIRMRECKSLVGRAKIAGAEVLLVKPQTFMNLSGVAVAALKEKYEVAQASRILVITDDLALPFGRIRIRRSGSAGGHNGLKSIIAQLHTLEFPRLRLGIAPDYSVVDTAAFVLSEFSRHERDTLAEMIARAAEAIETFLTAGIAEAMSKYN